MNEKYPLALPEGSVLAGQYIIEKVLGQGGFGITYEAKDHKTGERVAVKEFFPDAMATRTNHTTVSAFSGERGESFAYGKTCFLQEAETLAKFIGNENIVRIHSYFEENGTAYFVMDFIEGTSFDEYLKQRGGKIPFEEAAQILIPVMDALSVVHSQGIIHRDVTPDNIYITKEGVVKLLDFGAARYSLGDKSRSLDIILKHGFAPKEQYTRRGKQGPYTDVYALGATFYFALTGKRPPDSVERMDEDDLVPPSSLGVQISEAAEDAIMKALSIQTADRFQSMMAFKNAMHLSQREPEVQPVLAAVGSQPAVQQTYFTAPEPAGVSRTGVSAMPAPPAAESKQNNELQDLAATMKTAGKLAGKLAGKMAGQLAEKTAETAGVVAGTAGKMSEIVAAKKAETSERLAAKIAKSKEERSAKQASEEPRVDTAEAPARGAARPESKRPLVLAAVVLAVLLGILILKPGGSDKDNTPGSNTNKTDPSSTGTAAAGSDILYADFSPVGYNGNIINSGLSVADPNGNFYWIDDGRHSLHSTTDGNIYDNSEGFYFDLSLDGDELFFRYNNTVHAYNLKTKEDTTVNYLANFRNKVMRLFLTADYYVVGVESSNKTVTVYLVSRSTGQKVECCTAAGLNRFTISGDGMLYYIEDLGDGLEGIYGVSMNTLQKTECLAKTSSSDYGFKSPIVVGDNLYVMSYSKSDNSYYVIIKMDRYDGYNDNSLVWDLGSVLGFEARGSDYMGFNVNPVTDDMFFSVYEKDVTYHLYQIKTQSDGTYHWEMVSDGSFQPNFINYNDGSCTLNFWCYGEDNDKNAFKLYYLRYDANGNLIID